MSEEIVRYSIAKFFVPEGLYTIEELQRMLAAAIESSEKMNEALKKSMEKI